VSAADLVLIRRIDELHLEFPFAGSRLLRDLLARASHAFQLSPASELPSKLGV
jgi:putative transposase